MKSTPHSRAPFLRGSNLASNNLTGGCLSLKTDRACPSRCCPIPLFLQKAPSVHLGRLDRYLSKLIRRLGTKLVTKSFSLELTILPHLSFKLGGPLPLCLCRHMRSFFLSIHSFLFPFLCLDIFPEVNIPPLFIYFFYLSFSLSPVLFGASDFFCLLFAAFFW